MTEICNQRNTNVSVQFISSVQNVWYMHTASRTQLVNVCVNTSLDMSDTITQCRNTVPHCDVWRARGDGTALVNRSRMKTEKK